jgi:cell division cycle protein 20 (cofactor of APC complex)
MAMTFQDTYATSAPEFRKSGSLSLSLSSSQDGDRFIPNRCSMNNELSNFHLSDSVVNEYKPTNNNVGNEYKSMLTHSLYDGELDNAKVLSFKAKAPAPKESSASAISRSVLYSNNKLANQQNRQNFRHIPTLPERILDAPEMQDDYYLNLLDWSNNNILAVALNQCVYLWNASTGQIEKLMEVKEGEMVTSVSWVPLATPHIAIGTSDRSSCVQLWDVNKGKKLRSFDDHADRVGALAWNKHVLTSGSGDHSIVNRDVRQKNAFLSRWENAHSQEVIGLKWSPDGSQLASGGNDNVLNIWDSSKIRETGKVAPTHALEEHTAAVKALDWCPWQSNLLASGGGSSDRTLRFWNTKTGTCVNKVETGSQICSIKWSTHYKELVTSHGYSKNQLTVWKYPSLTKVSELTGHTARVLHMAISPDGQTVASAAADETIRFWKLFEYGKDSMKKKATSNSTCKDSASSSKKGAAMRARRSVR